MKLKQATAYENDPRELAETITKFTAAGWQLFENSSES